MTPTTQKQGIRRASNGPFPQGDTLADTLPKNGTSQSGDSTGRVSQGIYFPQKDGVGGYSHGHGAQGGLPPFIGNRYPGYPVTHRNEAGRVPKRTTAKRAERRLKRRTDAITKWWESLPTPRPFFFTPQQLSRDLGLVMRCLAPALMAIGWVRIQRRLNHKTGTYWLPPGSPIATWPPYTPRHFACL